MKKNFPAITKYLNHYAENEIHQLPAIEYSYHHVLVIPVFNEPLSFWENLKTSDALNNKEENILIILVINSPGESSQACNNQQLNKAILTDTLVLATTAQLTLLQLQQKKHILLVDRFSPGYGIPKKQGVGLARKIGADIALKLIHKGIILSPWIHTTDADTQLPQHYFKASRQETQAGALLYPFYHSHFSESSRLYEFSLFYYVDGLKWAGSPYAFHTLGSIIACHYQSYAQVRGYPKRAAGEDFYLLNKIAKVGSIRNLVSQPIKIQARLSDRVPFGTGPAINKIENMTSPQNEYLFYHPIVFIYLKTWLNTIKILWQFNTLETNQALEKAVATAITTNTTHSTEIESRIDQVLLIQCLHSLNINTQIHHGFGQCKTEQHFMRHMHQAFDGFQSLKFIHYLRKHKFSSIPINELFNKPVNPQHQEAPQWFYNKTFPLKPRQAQITKTFITENYDQAN